MIIAFMLLCLHNKVGDTRQLFTIELRLQEDVFAINAKKSQDLGPGFFLIQYKI